MPPQTLQSSDYHSHPFTRASILRSLLHSRRRSSPSVALASRLARSKKPAGTLHREVRPATMAEDRSWMYTGHQSRESIKPEWVEKATEFVERAFRSVGQAGEVKWAKCPCARCRNRTLRSKYDMQLHLGRYGFKPEYTVWWYHGEGYNLKPPKKYGDHPEEKAGLDGKKDGAGGGEEGSKKQEGNKREWEISFLEAYARSKLRKEDQMEWSYQKYLWEQEKAKQQQQSAPKTKRLRTSGSSAAQLAEDEGKKDATSCASSSGSI